MKMFFMVTPIILFFQNFLMDISLIISKNMNDHETHRDYVMESYVCISIMTLMATFFNSPFSDQSSTVQVSRVLSLLLMANYFSSPICVFVSFMILMFTESVYGGSDLFM